MSLVPPRFLDRCGEQMTLGRIWSLSEMAAPDPIHRTNGPCFFTAQPFTQLVAYSFAGQNRLFKLLDFTRWFPMADANEDSQWMTQALALAVQGEGKVEPNPMVGCVLVKDGRKIGAGWHEQFGQAHAEVNALASATESTAGATAYVTLEPCSHQGKTGPCSTALIKANIARVVVAHTDPNPAVSGQGIAQLRAAQIQVDVGIEKEAARQILAPYLKRVETGFPWVIGKWAMTLDGRIASATGDSQWISNATSRKIVHQIRGRVDAIMVGSGTASADDPMLNARPPGARVATRIVVDSDARLRLDSKLCQTAKEFPTLCAVGPKASQEKIARLADAGCDVWQSDETDPNDRLLALLKSLAQRGMTNVLVEGGGTLLGSLFDLGQLDETHVFIAPKLIGGQQAISPILGTGKTAMVEALSLAQPSVQQLDGDVYISGRPVWGPGRPVRDRVRSVRDRVRSVRNRVRSVRNRSSNQ